MPTSPSSTFRKSLLAAAVLGASGCASTAPNSGPAAGPNGGFVDSLADAGRATADATARAWHRTGYLLGLHDDASEPLDARPPLDEVDLAMLEEDAPVAPRIDSIAAVEQAIVRPSAARVGTADGDALIGGDGELIALNAPQAPLRIESDAPTAGARFVAPGGDAGDAPAPIATLAEAPATLGAPTGMAELPGDAVATNDYTHVVGETETLWDIAKKTTGDATNWHVLADVNDLAPDAAVHPGQGLMIPADMLRPELALGAEAPATTMVPEARGIETDAASGRLAIPAADVVAASDVGAAARPSPVAPLAELPSDDARGFKVQAGESLWDFAKRTTGDATYWQAIAAHNGFDEQRAVAVRAGEEIFVPDSLVRPELAGGTAVAVAAPAAPAVAEPTESARMVPIAEASAALPADAADPVAAAAPASILDETREIKIVEAAYRGDGDAALPADAPTEIMISGTYYPKAIYNDADFSSSLLMRVSPGTTLKVAGVDGPWYAVETDDGLGYVHDRDIK